MKRTTWFRTSIAAALMVSLAGILPAQDEERPERPERPARGERAGPDGPRGPRGPDGPGGPGGPGRGLMMHPLMMAIDLNGDGELSAEEIAGAAEALKKLDTNEDGKITLAELRPQFGRGGPGGPFGRGGPGRPEGARGPGGPRGFGGPGGPRGPGGPGGPEFVTRLMQFDRDEDGKLSREEVPPRMAEMMFDRIDTNNDGFLDKAELEQFSASRRPGARGPREGRRPRGEGRPQGEE